MSSSKKFVTSLIIVSLATMLLSWHQFGNRKPKTTHSFFYDELSANKDDFTQQLNESEISVFTEDEDWSPSDSIQQFPPAEDVLVQKIPGDNNHLLMMAYYSKENYSGQFVTINNGGHLVFRDDGKGYDKIAGDGLFTERVSANVGEFRRTAKAMNEEMKNSGNKRIRFINRAMVIDPDVSENFDEQALDNNQTVSITNLTTDRTKLFDSLRTHSIFITDLSVVEDPSRTWNYCTQKGNINGPWTFKTLIQQLASPSPSNIATDAETSDFVKNWLNKWSNSITINGDFVAARPLVKTKILDPWLTKSRNAGAPTGQLDMKFAPFKLTAIVNRFDIRKFATGIPAGEGRFIFCLIDNTCSQALPFTMILEYGINKPNNCDAMHAWAQQWFDLKDHPVGTNTYNAALEKITKQFTLCGSNPNKPNQNCLNSLRTNDRALSPSPVRCEFRDFDINGGTHQIRQRAVGRAPADRYNAHVDNAAVRRLVKFINQNSKVIISQNFEIPFTFLDSPLISGKSQILGPTVGLPTKVNVYHWDGTKTSGTPTFIRSNAARHAFSLNTCSGCHSGETQTNFTHVDAVFFGREATLSGFLSGKAGQGGAIDFDNDPKNDSMMVEDPALRPAGDPALHLFNEMVRRTQDLKSFVHSTCGSVLSIRDELMFQPVNMVD